MPLGPLHRYFVEFAGGLCLVLHAREWEDAKRAAERLARQWPMPRSVVKVSEGLGNHFRLRYYRGAVPRARV